MAVGEAIARGDLPCWTQPDLRLRFLRPLSSALLTMDHALFGRAPLGYHLHSIVWYLAFIAAASLLFRKALPGATGAVALVLFAIDDCHVSTAAWIASRHALVSTTPALLGLWAHLRYRDEGWKPGRWLSFVGIAVGLLGGEMALGVVGYWLAFELFAPRAEDAGRWRARLWAAAPILGFAGAYLAAYKVLGCGVRGSDLYVDPLADPHAFALALVKRVPMLLGDLLGGLVSDGSMMLPATPFIAVGVIATVGFILLYRATLPFIPETERRALRWLVPGALLSLLVVVGGLTSARLLLLPSVGSAALVATFLRFGLRGAEGGITATRSVLRRVSLRHVGWGIVVLVHIVFSSLLFATTPLIMQELATKMEAIAGEAEIGPDQGQHVFLVGASDPSASRFYAAAIRAFEDPARIAGWHLLSIAKYPHRLTRTGPSSFRVQVVNGRMMEGLFERIYRSSRATFAVGDQVVSGGARVTVRAIEVGKDRADAFPTEIEVQFGVPLEDASLTFLTWRAGRLRRLSLPEVGGSIELPWEPGPATL